MDCSDTFVCKSNQSPKTVVGVQGRSFPTPRCASKHSGFLYRLRSLHPLSQYRLRERNFRDGRRTRAQQAPLFLGWTKGRGFGRPEKRREAGAQRRRGQATWLCPAEAPCSIPETRASQNNELSRPTGLP